MKIKTAEEFAKDHFPGLEKETWYPTIIAIADGYKDYIVRELCDGRLKLPDGKPQWFEVSEKKLPEYVSIQPLDTDLPPKFFHVDGIEMWYSYYRDILLGVQYKTGGGTMIHYLQPATKEQYIHYRLTKEK